MSRKGTVKKSPTKKAVSYKGTAKKTALNKPAAPSAVVKGTAAKKAIAKKVVAKKASGRYTAHPAGYVSGPAGISVPAPKKVPKPKSPAGVVQPSKMEAGFKSALASVQRLLNDAIDDLAENVKESLEIEKIELSLSFNAKGEFLGIGVGGAASIKVCLKPLS